MMKTALITGGSCGIGLETSKHFAQNGYQLLWVSLLEDELQTAKQQLNELFPKTPIHTLALDLSKEDAAQKVHKWVNQNNWKLDVLINNAGMGTYGFLHETNWDKEMTMINLNLLNVYRMTRLFLEDMQKRNEGTIINISSISALQPVPKMTTYASTKAFIAHFSKSLNEELKMQNSKVRVLTVLPAAIRDTNFKAAAKMNKVKTFEGLATTTAQEVAKDTWNGFNKKKGVIISGWKGRFLSAFRHITPDFILQSLVNREVKEA